MIQSNKQRNAGCSDVVSCGSAEDVDDDSICGVADGDDDGLVGTGDDENNFLSFAWAEGGSAGVCLKKSSDGSESVVVKYVNRSMDDKKAVWTDSSASMRRGGDDSSCMT